MIIEVWLGWFLKMDHSLLVHHLPKAKNQGIEGISRILLTFYWTFGIIEVRAGLFLKMDPSLLVHHLLKARNQEI